MSILDFIFYVFVALLGLSVGSFLNVVILRFDTAESIINGRSHCPKCKRLLPWYEMVPFISYILLAGKCRGCKNTISIQYPLVELATAIIFVLIYYFFGLTIQSLLLAIISSILIVLATYDILHLEIPDILSYLAIGFTIILVVLELSKQGGIFSLKDWSSYGYGILAGTGFLGLLVICSRQKWMGAGDVLLGAFMGLLLGFPNILVALFSAFLIGSVFGLTLVTLKIKKLRDPVPFGPFLVFGTFIALFWGEKIINNYWNFYW